MTKPTTADCIARINEIIRAIIYDEDDCDVLSGDDQKILEAIRAQLLAAQEMAKAWGTGTCDEMDEALIAWRKAGGE